MQTYFIADGGRKDEAPLVTSVNVNTPQGPLKETASRTVKVAIGKMRTNHV